MIVGIEFEKQFKDKTHEKLISKLGCWKGVSITRAIRFISIQTVYEMSCPVQPYFLLFQVRGFPPVVFVRLKAFRRE